MEFGIPREVRDHEKRVGLTPSTVLSLIRAGHSVYVERDAGAGAGFSDEEYRQAGAKVVYSAAEAYGRADVVVKVARPVESEYDYFRNGQTIFSFLHLAVASSGLFAALAEHEITAIAYEMIQDDNGNFPVQLPTSQVAGRLAPLIAGQLLASSSGGRGVLLSGIPGVSPATVVIVGGGVVGANAARAFLGLNTLVTVLDRNLERLQYLDDLFNGQLRTMLSNQYNLEKTIPFADVLVGCIQVPGQRSPVVVTREMLAKMRRGSVAIDLSIDNGGCFETSRPTSLSNQTYVAEGVIHHCVPNVTATVARTASVALSNAILPCLRSFGSHGVEKTASRRSALTRGMNLYQGRLVNPEIARALGRELDLELPLGETIQ
ncbi:MAG: alanine dehydrogenase [Anaerolineae bacterium]